MPVLKHAGRRLLTATCITDEARSIDGRPFVHVEDIAGNRVNFVQSGENSVAALRAFCDATLRCCDEAEGVGEFAPKPANPKKRKPKAAA